MRLTQMLDDEEPRCNPGLDELGLESLSSELQGGCHVTYDGTEPDAGPVNV